MAKKQKNLDDITKKFGDERQKALDNALEIGKFIQREKYDEQTIQQYEARLRESGFYDWAAEEE